MLPTTSILNAVVGFRRTPSYLKSVVSSFPSVSSCSAKICFPTVSQRAAAASSDKSAMLQSFPEDPVTFYRRDYNQIVSKYLYRPSDIPTKARFLRARLFMYIHLGFC